MTGKDFYILFIICFCIGFALHIGAFIYEYWWLFALCGFSIFVAFCIGLYRTYYQRNEQEKNE